jgi:hypothetical protein
VDDQGSISGRDRNNYLLRHIYTGSETQPLILKRYWRLLPSVQIGWIVTLTTHIHLL